MYKTLFFVCSSCFRVFVVTVDLWPVCDLLTLVPPAETRLPAAWRRTATGEPMPDVVRAVRRSREGR